MNIYLLICASVDSNTSLYFFNDKTTAIMKYSHERALNEDVRLYQIFSSSVEQVFPQRGTALPIEFGEEIILPL